MVYYDALKMGLGGVLVQNVQVVACGVYVEDLEALLVWF